MCLYITSIIIGIYQPYGLGKPLQTCDGHLAEVAAIETAGAFCAIEPVAGQPPGSQPLWQGLSIAGLRQGGAVRQGRTTVDTNPGARHRDDIARQGDD